MWKKKTIPTSTEEESTKLAQMRNRTSHNKVTSVLTKKKSVFLVLSVEVQDVSPTARLVLKWRKKNSFQSEKRWAPASIRQVIGTTGAANNSSPFFAGSGRVWDGKGYQDSDCTFSLQNCSREFNETWQWRYDRQMYGDFIQLKIRSRKSLAGKPNFYSNFTNFGPLLKTDNHTNKKKTRNTIFLTHSTLRLQFCL
jgi:hypothetical protein